MKRVALITLCLLLGVFISPVFAVEVTLFGPEKYTKDGCGPTVHTDSRTISGLFGSGKIILTNHGKKWWQRMRFIKIWLNDELIVKPSDLKGFPRRIEKEVTFQETNEIKVKLWGFKGKSVSLELTKDVVADAAGVVDSDGGEIVAPNGSSLILPPGAVTEPTLITIDEPSTPPPLPDYMTPAGPAVEFGPGGLVFDKIALMSLPLTTLPGDNKIFGASYYSTSTGEWEYILPSAYDAEEQKLFFYTNHFTIFIAVTLLGPSFTEPVITDFDIEKDSLSFRNEGQIIENINGPTSGQCVGISYLAKEFFKVYRNASQELYLRSVFHNLPDLDDPINNQYAYTAAKITKEIQEDFNNRNWWGKLKEPIFDIRNHRNIALNLINELNNSNAPVQLTIDGEGKDAKHMVLVYGWTPTGSENGIFQIYDVNDNCKSRTLKYKNGNLIYIEEPKYVDFYFDGTIKGVKTIQEYLLSGKYLWSTDGDNDGDGVGNNDDLCPGTPCIDCHFFTCVEDNGCFLHDSDGDNFTDDNSINECTSYPIFNCCLWGKYNEDCNDTDPTIYPGAPEICDDGIDNNCNGQVDEGCQIGLMGYAHSVCNPLGVECGHKK